MAVRLRLRRTGTRNKPCYRVVAADQRCKRDGRFIEILGFYDPRGSEERLDMERVDYWLGNGAQPSETVATIIERARKGVALEKPAAPVVEEPVIEAPAAEEVPVAEEAPAEEASAEEAAPAEEATEEAKSE